MCRTLGIELVRGDIPHGQYFTKPERRSEALKWLAEQDRIARRRESAVLWLTAIAAIGGLIAAWPVVKGWF